MAEKLGSQIDRLRELDVEIQRLEAPIKKLKKLRNKLESKLLRSFDKEDIDGCKGKIGVASVRKLRLPQISHLRRFHKYIIKNRALDLLQNRVSVRAYLARLDEGEHVPGITIFNKIKVSVRKR
jgi:hypothetical protein